MYLNFNVYIFLKSLKSFEERNKALETIVQNHKDQTTFEQFASCVYSPAPVKPYASSRSSGNIFY